MTDLRSAAQAVVDFDPSPWDENEGGWIFQQLLKTLRAALAAAPPAGDGAANFDAAVQRAFAGSGVEVRTSFTPSADEFCPHGVLHGGEHPGFGWTCDKCRIDAAPPAGLLERQEALMAEVKTLMAEVSRLESLVAAPSCGHPSPAALRHALNSLPARGLDDDGDGYGGVPYISLSEAILAIAAAYAGEGE